MFLITNLKLNRKVRREHAKIDRALEIKLIEQKAVYRFMDELSARGFDIIDPKLS
jgi:hypothetical protein